MTRPKIITVHEYPPIPIRDYDWCAYRDGDEEKGDSFYGWGKTELEAVWDLIRIERERAEAEDPEFAEKEEIDWESMKP